MKVWESSLFIIIVFISLKNLLENYKIKEKIDYKPDIREPYFIILRAEED